MAAFEIHRILCPTDFSPSADVAVDMAAGLAERFGAELHLAHVWSPPTVVAFDGAIIPSADQLVAYTESLQQALDATVKRVAGHGRGPKKHLVQGIAWREIAELAATEKCDLIVMGTHGRSGVSHFLIGSVAERVVRSAPVPVLVVPTPKKK